MRFVIAALIVALPASVWAQGLPGGVTPDQLRAVPPEVLRSLPANVLSKIPLSTLKQLPPDLFTDIPPDLLRQIPPNAATMTPEQAKAYYRGLDPATKRSLKEQLKLIKAKIDSVPGLMDKLKALYAALKGS